MFKPYHGRDAVATILAGVAHVLKGWTCQREIGGHDQPDHALVFKGRIGDKEIEGCDFLHVNEDGLIDEFYVMVRPLSAALTLAEAMKRQLAPTPDDKGQLGTGHGIRPPLPAGTDQSLRTSPASASVSTFSSRTGCG